MNRLLSDNLRATLLLTAPLIAGRTETSPRTLSLSEYNRLARILREQRKQSADLIGPEAEDITALCAQAIDRSRLESLLGREEQLSESMERWAEHSIWVVDRTDAEYPERLKARLHEHAPPVLYGCGDISLLDAGGLAVVGSRHVDDALIGYTENVGRLAAEAHCTVISGGAKGIDRAAMRGCLDGGGTVVSVMSDSLERAALTPDNRELLTDRRLVLVSPNDPMAGFHVGLAMGRNKHIYALADAALVVTSDFEKGGTWAGAIEQLERLHLVPVFVRDGDDVGRGNAALLQRGGQVWPEPRSCGELVEVIEAGVKAMARGSGQEELGLK